MMGQTLQDYEPELGQMTADLRMSSTNILVTATAIAGGAWLLMLALVQAGRISMEILPVAVLIFACYAASRYLIPRNLKLAHVAWLFLFTCTITVAFLIFKKADILYLLALVPMAAITTLGGWAAILSGGGMMVLLVGLHYFAQPVLVPLSLIGMIGFGEILSGLIGYSAVYPFLTTVEWLTYSYRMATQNLEEARNQRIELQQVQEDLLVAYRELNRLTNSLKIMTQKAEEARQAKQDFVANVSHELRTPLNMIIGYTNLIMKSPLAYGKRLPARLLADISSIQRNSRHLVDLINDVLDLSQVDAGRMALTRKWTNIQEIVTAAVTAVESFFATKGLYLRSELPSENIRVSCDSTRIREVILNLLSNAGRFTEEGGVVVKVCTNQGNVVVSVRDTGPGISEEDRQRVFEPFQQLDPSLHHRLGGSGLGLTISEKFVTLHHGKMWLESVEGQGTTFYFSLPLEPIISLEENLPSSSHWVNPYQDFTPRQRRFKAPPPVYTPRMVVVEQEPNLFRLMARYMDELELAVTASVEEALKSVENNPALMIVVNTPDLEKNPVEQLTVPYHIPIISCWVPGREESISQMGVIRYLLKPVDQDTLLSEIDHLEKEEMDILLVDDDLEFSQLIARIISLSRPSYHVMRATSGEEALLLMQERQPDLVLLDLVMPGLSGFDVLRIKKSTAEIKEIPVIILSSTDVSGIPIVANRFGVYKTDGLSVKEFLDSLMAISRTLNPDLQKQHPEQPGTAPG